MKVKVVVSLIRVILVNIRVKVRTRFVKVGVR